MDEKHVSITPTSSTSDEVFLEQLETLRLKRDYKNVFCAWSNRPLDAATAVYCAIMDPRHNTVTWHVIHRDVHERLTTDLREPRPVNYGQRPTLFQ